VQIKFYREATDELEEALNWYAARSPNARSKFSAGVKQSIASIIKTPHRYLKLSHSHRACRVIGFPYQVIYRVAGDIVIVVAIAHTSRRPGYWKRRR
jgi:plasmid stabilization system protein ParE